MYAVIYYFKEREGQSVVEKEFHGGEIFRLRRNALHYVREILQRDYRDKGYATEALKDGIFCYKSEKTDSGNRKVTEVRIQVVKA